MTRIREATPADVPAVCNVLDGAALETDVERIRASVDRGETLVAVSDADGGATAADPSDGTVLGALVREGDRVLAVAVRRRRRGQGIGSALVRAAAADRDRLVASFDADVAPFYESLGFDVVPLDSPDRCRGVWTAGDG